MITLVIVVCVCLSCATVALFSMDGIDKRTLDNLLGLLLIGIICGGPILIVAFIVFLQLRHNAQARMAGRRLAAELGFETLNQNAHEMLVWYVGQAQDHRVAIKPTWSKYQVYSEGGYRGRVSFYLRIILEVKLPQPTGIVANHGTKNAVRNPQIFEQAFRLENAEHLTGEARKAMFDFVQKGYPIGLSGDTLRLNKGTRSLSLYDRTAIPGDWLIPEVLPGAHTLLIHDHLDVTIAVEALKALVDEMLVVARAIENQT